MEGMGAVTETELRAKIAATLQRGQAADARIQSLDVEIEQAEKRQELRRALEKETALLEQREKAIQDKVAYRLHIDADRAGSWSPFVATGNSLGRNRGSTSCGLDVSRGEYVWELRQFSWLHSVLLLQDAGSVCSEEFQAGGYKFYLVYQPFGHLGLVNDVPAQRGTLAISKEGRAKILLRYRVYVKARDGKFVQWGKMRDAVHDMKDDYDSVAYGPDVCLCQQGCPPGEFGIFGLTHPELVESEWVQNDTLTVKFEIEVRPDGPMRWDSLRNVVDVPGAQPQRRYRGSAAERHVQRRSVPG